MERLFSKVHIPQEKLTTYEAARKLFNNYIPDETQKEHPTSRDKEETDALLTSLLKTEVMDFLTFYLERKLHVRFEKKDLYSLLHTLWFTPF